MAPPRLSHSEALASLKKRLDEKWLLNPTNGCWEWQGTTRYGYGLIWAAHVGGARLAHRMSYELYVKPIPDGLHIDHLCRNRCCINPAHLEPVTQAENNRRQPISAGTINRDKTHCPQGHPYDQTNTYWLSGNRRDCRECRNEIARNRRKSRREAKNIILRKDRTHCPSGHPYAGSNLIIDQCRRVPRRICRECSNATARRYQQRKREANK